MWKLLADHSVRGRQQLLYTPHHSRSAVSLFLNCSYTNVPWTNFRKTELSQCPTSDISCRGAKVDLSYVC
jgi:hypothetical protein